MTKQHFIALADLIKSSPSYVYTEETIQSLAEFCQTQNPNFNRERWFSYIKGECGPSGGKVKA